MNRKGSYIFTSKKHPERGIMSTILGIISIASMAAAIYMTYMDGGNAKPQFGAVGLLVTIFAFAGIILGVLGKMEKERYYLFPWLGIVLNLLALVMVSMVLYAGAYGI